MIFRLALHTSEFIADDLKETATKAIDDIEGLVEPRDVAGRLRYRGRVHRAPGTTAIPAVAGSLSEFLLERYTAFTHERGRARLFRVWHEPWPVRSVNIDLVEDEALACAGGWYRRAKLVAADFSPGVQDVWMGRPRRVPRAELITERQPSGECRHHAGDSPGTGARA